MSMDKFGGKMTRHFVSRARRHGFVITRDRDDLDRQGTLSLLKSSLLQLGSVAMPALAMWT